MNAAAVNKIYAIRHHQAAIDRARKLLQAEGWSPAYYAWHKRTIEINEAEIQKIKEEAETTWN